MPTRNGAGAIEFRYPQTKGRRAKKWSAQWVSGLGAYSQRLAWQVLWQEFTSEVLAMSFGHLWWVAC